MLFPDDDLKAALRAAANPSDVLRSFTEFRIHSWIGAVARKNTPISKEKKLSFVSENDGETLQLTEEETLFKDEGGEDYNQLEKGSLADQTSSIGYDPGLEEHVVSTDPVVTIPLRVESFTDSSVTFKRGYGVIPRSYDGRYAYLGKLYGPNGVLTGNLVHISRKVLYGAKVPVYGFHSSAFNYEPSIDAPYFSVYSHEAFPGAPILPKSDFEKTYGEVLMGVFPASANILDPVDSPFYILQYSESNPESPWVRHVSEIDGSLADFPIAGHELTPGGVIVLNQLSISMAKVLDA